MWAKDRVQVSADDEGPIYDVLRKLSDGKQTIRILVDYSSMSRLWYAGVLNWARYASQRTEIIIDLLYSAGEYHDAERPIMVISDILSVPGLEGGPLSLNKSVSIFGLGFDAFASLCVLDRLEPDIVYAYIASPGAFGNYPERARESNKELIDYAQATLELPLASVESTYKYLTEVVAPHIGSADITIVPMGPKPHVLAAILLAIRFQEVGCLRVSTKRHSPLLVRPNGQIVCSRVEFKAE